MSFTTADNPFIKQSPPKPTPRRYSAEDGRVFETTGEVRRAKKGEFVVGPMSSIFGAAQANRDTEDEYPILRQVET